MPLPLIECIPNFSEGQNPEIIRELKTVVAQVPGVFLLDCHSDPDHNRTVVTFAGTPHAVLEAAWNSVRTAAKLIDLRNHAGTHPRIGATDVIPFIPLEGATISECVVLARQLGQRVGEELGIPVYLYEAAARRADRSALEKIRRGGYEALVKTIALDPSRAPDFGPTRIGPAGATAVGARAPLIAFNLYLDTNEVQIARIIARKVRTSSGGLPAVKALGMLVGGFAQVSINLTNYVTTSLEAVFLAVQSEAEILGTRILRSEIVGLVPEAALRKSAIQFLKLSPESAQQVLEARLAEAQSASKIPVLDSNFLEKLSSAAPIPGGGSAAAYSAAIASALILKTARITLRTADNPSVQSKMKSIIEELILAQRHLELLVTEDAIVFQHAIRLRRTATDARQAENTNLQRQNSFSETASSAQRSLAQLAFRVLEISEIVVQDGSPACLPDGLAAAQLAATAVKIACRNIEANLADGETPPTEIQMLTRCASDLESEILRKHSRSTDATFTK
jgi:glutamate formiminotransferase / formiminotetrahydrofolate cyclodeaminase